MTTHVIFGNIKYNNTLKKVRDQLNMRSFIILIEKQGKNRI